MRLSFLALLLIPFVVHGQDAEDTVTPPSNVTAGSLTRGQNDVWGSDVEMGPSKKYKECKLLLANELGANTPAASSSGTTGFHLTPVRSPAQGYARAGGAMLFVFTFFFIVGIFKYLTNNVLIKGTQSFSASLVTMYSEISVFAIIGLLGFVILRLNALPQYSVTFLPGQPQNTLTVLFENIEITMFLFVLFYTVIGLTLVGIGLNISDTWSTYETNATRSCVSENNKLRQYKQHKKEKLLEHQLSSISYLCLRDDFVRNMPGKDGLRGPDNALLFDFSRYLTLRLSTQLKGILKMTLPQWGYILFASLLAALASAFPLAAQLTLGQLVSWSLVGISFVVQHKYEAINNNLNRGAKGRGVKVDVEASQEDNNTLIEKNAFNKMLVDPENDTPQDKTTTSSLTLSRQDTYLACGGGKSGMSYMRGTQRGLLLGNALIASLQIHLCFRAAHASYGWVLGISAFSAFALTIHYIGRTLIQFTLMSSVDFYRCVSDMDQVIGEQEQLVSHSAALYLVHLACEQFQVTKQHDKRNGKDSLLRSENELELHSLSTADSSSSSNSNGENGTTTYDALISNSARALVTIDDANTSSATPSDRSVQKLRHLMVFFSFGWVNVELCRNLLEKFMTSNQKGNTEDHFKQALELILELTSPDSDLPLLLFEAKLNTFAKGKFLLSLLNQKINKGGTFLEGKKGKTFMSNLQDDIDNGLSITKENSPANEMGRVMFESCVQRMNELPAHTLNVLIPLLVAKTNKKDSQKTTDSRYLVDRMKLSKGRLNQYVAFCKLMVSRARTVQSRWQNVYPSFHDAKGTPVSATIASVAKAMAMTAIGAHGNAFVGLSAGPPSPPETDEDAETKE